ncbi:MAG TPA: DUF302 domain-containing protein [Gemmatimonadaceae bacterium]|nr:DUF302 domain-containing protein [Gemmatimonadaceae bacterium]
MERHAIAYGFSTTVALPHAETLRLTKAALAAEGFGVLCETDMEAMLRMKIGADVGPYVMLAACNPSLANAAVGLDRDIGLLLPCNVVVYAARDASRTVVSVIDPERLFSLAEAHGLLPIASDATARLLRTLRAIEQFVPPVVAPATSPLRPNGADTTIEEIC